MPGMDYMGCQLEEKFKVQTSYHDRKAKSTCAFICSVFESISVCQHDKRQWDQSKKHQESNDITQ